MGLFLSLFHYFSSFGYCMCKMYSACLLFHVEMVLNSSLPVTVSVKVEGKDGARKRVIKCVLLIRSLFVWP